MTSRLDTVRTTMTFIPAGGYLVYAASTSTIQSAYGITNVTGNWPGSLQNNGETIVLRNAAGEEIDRVRYDDESPWPTAADGKGPSIERIDLGEPGNNSANLPARQAPSTARERRNYPAAHGIPLHRRGRQLE